MKTKLCKPVLVEIKETKEKKLWLNIETKKLWYDDFGKVSYVFKPQQIILVSTDPDEKIEKYDLVYNPTYKTLYQWVVNADIKFDKIDAKKVIATQDQLPEAYIKRFIQEYNHNDIKDVRIEMELDEHFDYIPKLLNGKVIIKGEVKYNFSFYDVRLVIDQFICEECPQYSQKGNGGTYLHKFIKERGIEPSVIYTEEEFKERARIAFEDSCKYSSFEDFYKEHKKQ